MRRAVGVRSFGTIGVVMRAKIARVIPAARPVIEALVNAGMYVTPKIVDEALRRIDE